MRIFSSNLIPEVVTWKHFLNFVSSNLVCNYAGDYTNQIFCLIIIRRHDYSSTQSFYHYIFTPKTSYVKTNEFFILLRHKTINESFSYFACVLKQVLAQNFSHENEFIPTWSL